MNSRTYIIKKSWDVSANCTQEITVRTHHTTICANCGKTLGNYQHRFYVGKNNADELHSWQYTGNTVTSFYLKNASRSNSYYSCDKTTTQHKYFLHNNNFNHNYSYPTIYTPELDFGSMETVIDGAHTPRSAGTFKGITTFL